MKRIKPKIVYVISLMFLHIVHIETCYDQG